MNRALAKGGQELSHKSIAPKGPAALFERVRLRGGPGELGALHLDQGRPGLQALGPGD